MAVRIGLRAVRRFGGSRHFPVRLCLVRGQRHFDARRRRSGRACPLRLVCAGGGASECGDLFRRAHCARTLRPSGWRRICERRRSPTSSTWPLGYFNANLTGRLRKQIDDNAALTETLLAHTIPDAVGGIVTPILAVGLLFVFDWRMGLACLIPMIIGLVCLMTMMTGTSMKFFEEYQRAGERISAEATEYVRGIPVVKVFQQTVYSFKSFHAAILSYRDLASGYAMMCRMPYTLLTVVLNAMFLLLMPLGMVLIGSAADGWAVLADLVFYIFFAPQLAFMMERLMYAVNAQMEAAEAVNKLEAILKESPLPEPAADSGSKPADSSISFENVTFSYDGADRPALTNVSLPSAAGEAWALVGPSGGGKTTIARLIPRFFDVQAGAVLLGGRDVCSIPTAELMEQISFVFRR